jgi:hypothetical protein
MVCAIRRWSAPSRSRPHDYGLRHLQLVQSAPRTGLCHGRPGTQPGYPVATRSTTTGPPPCQPRPSRRSSATTASATYATEQRVARESSIQPPPRCRNGQRPSAGSPTTTPRHPAP